MMAHNQGAFKLNCSTTLQYVLCGHETTGQLQLMGDRTFQLKLKAMSFTISYTKIDEH